jgi:signal transduction histidine kinase
MADPVPQLTVARGWRRPLLPAALLAEPGHSRSARDWIVDVTVFGLALLLGTIALAQTWQQHDGLPLQVVDVVLGVLSLGLLWVRRSQPLLVAVVVIAASMVSSLAIGAALAAVFNAALRVETRFFPLVLGLMAGTCAISPVLYPSADNSYTVDLVIGLLFAAVVFACGIVARVQRDYVVALHEHAAQLAAEQRLHVAAAREAERRRIAREMHDVLAHRVSLLSVHAGALEFRPDAPPEEIAAAAGVIRESAHATLEELRAIVGVVREDDGDAVEPPQPTLGDLPALVEESRAAGMRVAWRGDVDGAAVSDAVGRTAYRVVQEGLTNARKHAAGAGVEVAVRAAAAGPLVVEVVSRPPVAPHAAPEVPGGGTGLIGLAERVALAGGTLDHGPDAAGDFVLRATLPVAA